MQIERVVVDISNVLSTYIKATNNTNNGHT